ESLSEQLTLHEEFETALAATASEGLKQARNGHVDLVLLDVGLPDLDGREACKLLRRGGFKGPIVMLTAQVSDSDTILGLESGANDYVTKPFKLGVLLARIRAQLRQHEQSEDALFTIGPYTFKPASKLLLDGDGHKIRLTEKETSILKYLYRAGERVVTRDVLRHEVWGYNAGVTTHTLETHIYRLRQKIEKDPSQAELLITETGGYKLRPGAVPRTGGGVVTSRSQNPRRPGRGLRCASSRASHRAPASRRRRPRAPALSRYGRGGGRGSTRANRGCDNSTRGRASGLQGRGGASRRSNYARPACARSARPLPAYDLPPSTAACATRRRSAAARRLDRQPLSF